jgi:hypothetical protein
MPNHYYPPVGKCIYCSETELLAGISRFGDEHVIPLSMGGNLVLREASCRKCEKIINQQIETPVTSQEWGYFRTKRDFPTRSRKNRKTHKELRRVDGSLLRVPIKDYSAPVIMYKFGEARILSGLAPGTDNLRWTVVMLADHEAEMEMQRKFPDWDKRHTIKAQPHEFARFLAKIAHGYATAELGMGTFSPHTLDIILGRSDDYYNLVGGSWDIVPAVPGGDHVTNISFKFVSPERAFVILDIRLFSQAATPNYHVVVGEIDLKNPDHFRSFEKRRLGGQLLIGSPAIG